MKRNQVLLSPSLLSADFRHLEEDIKAVDQAGADWLHIDIMDGTFVPNITFGIPVMKCIRPCTDKLFDVHMMVQSPDHIIPDVVAAGGQMIVVHAEATTHLHRTIQLIHSLGAKAGVALNPATPLCVLDYVIEDVDLVLLMSVNPGFGGQTYIPAVTEKIRQLRKMIDDRGLSTRIEMDGGVDFSNAGMLIEAGADVLVSGSKIFADDPSANTKRFMEILAKYNQ